MHVGTNDLKRKSAKDVAIIHREDNQELKEKAFAVNKELARYSEQKKFSMKLRMKILTKIS